MGWMTSDKEKDDLKLQFEKREDLCIQQIEKIEALEKEVFKLRTKIAELMNAVMSYGDEELLDEFETIITE